MVRLRRDLAAFDEALSQAIDVGRTSAAGRGAAEETNCRRYVLLRLVKVGYASAAPPRIATKCRRLMPTPPAHTIAAIVRGWSRHGCGRPSQPCVERPRAATAWPPPHAASILAVAYKQGAYQFPGKLLASANSG